MDATGVIEREVRELVRRRGLDPSTDTAAIRKIVDDVIADYDERTLSSAMPPVADAATAAREVYDSVAGFGPLQRWLDDPTVEEIWINERLTQGSPLPDGPASRLDEGVLHPRAVQRELLVLDQRHDRRGLHHRLVQREPLGVRLVDVRRLVGVVDALVDLRHVEVGVVLVAVGLDLLADEQWADAGRRANART